MAWATLNRHDSFKFALRHCLSSNTFDKRSSSHDSMFLQDRRRHCCVVLDEWLSIKIVIIPKLYFEISSFKTRKHKKCFVALIINVV